jgi:hypothetical protein
MLGAPVGKEMSHCYSSVPNSPSGYRIGLRVLSREECKPVFPEDTGLWSEHSSLQITYTHPGREEEKNQGRVLSTQED